MTYLGGPIGPSMVMWEIFLVLAAGVANWIITYIIVAGAIFDGSRALVRQKCSDIEGWCDRQRNTRRTRTVRCLAGKGRYLVGCQLCCGVWVGFLLTPFVPGPFHFQVPVIAVVLNGLVIKAIGHATLELTSVWRNRNALLEQQIRLVETQRQVIEDGAAALLLSGSGSADIDVDCLAEEAVAGHR